MSTMLSQKKYVVYQRLYYEALESGIMCWLAMDEDNYKLIETEEETE